MKITDITVYVVNPSRRNYVYVRVDTDSGVHGIGEAYSCGPDLATAACIEYFREWLIGQDPTRPEYIWQFLYNYSRFPGGSILNSAISGIDLALWDIMGKLADMPVYKLFGGPTRDKIWCYSGSARGATADEAVDKTRALVEKHGYTALKLFQPFAGDMPVGESRRNMAETFAAFRDAFGDNMEMGIDFHARNYEPHRAVWFAEAIKEYRPFFIEEPIRMENIKQMAALKDKLGAPLATGECLYTKYEFNDLLEADAVDILQPDILLCGGFTETKKIAAMAECSYKVVAPHSPLSPLSTVIGMHFAACIPNFLALETHDHNIGGDPACNDLITKVYSPMNGYLPLPDGPGWGVDLNYDYIKTLSYKPWARPFAKRDDGGIDVV
ncbi:MAG: mandelate racemase/muconate lactonizing enzyme family protein [Christensenellales bacterium]|jgi:galactonate dehydratase